MIGDIEKTRKPAAGPTDGKRPTRAAVNHAGLASTDTEWSWAANQLQSRSHRPLNRFIKSRITLSLCIVLGTGFVPVQAADNAAQAACRAVLEQKLKQANAWDPQPLTEAADASAVATAAPAGKPAVSVASMAGTASTRTTTPQKTVTASASQATAPVPAAPTLASVASAPDAIAPDAVAAPKVAAPMVSATVVAPPVKGHGPSLLLMVSFLIASLFTVMVLLLKLRQLKLKLRQMDSRF